MKRILLLSFFLLLLHQANGQSLFIPNGSISNSENSNIGIGVNNPEKRLHIKNGDFLIELHNNKYPPKILMEKFQANPYLTFYRWTGVENKYFATRLLHRGSFGLKIQIQNNATSISDIEYIDVMNFLNNGSIGIGTSSTGDHRLAVEGSIGAREVKVTTDFWPDYVFDQDYNLLPLSVVEKYILRSKHLPDIPNAKEVNEQGIELGEMNSKLLQKVEELTLYIIQINKKLEYLEEENNRLKDLVE
ncbi:hypothetical protein [Zunongwangia sp.]|uniref:hypothetical protein n=1 Tax=Zunongwangia sp. TaxID=1965325 RepID=UPI003AA86474